MVIAKFYTFDFIDNQLLKKLQIKVGFKVKVVNAPENFSAIIRDIASDIELSFNTKSVFEALLVFAITKADLHAALKQRLLELKPSVGFSILKQI